MAIEGFFFDPHPDDCVLAHNLNSILCGKANPA
jgi:hypothetical protein